LDVAIDRTDMEFRQATRGLASTWGGKSKDKEMTRRRTEGMGIDELWEKMSSRSMEGRHGRDIMTRSKEEQEE